MPPVTPAATPAATSVSKSINVLLVGSGGREHALAWKLAQSPSLARLYAAPGNPGIAEHAELAALDVADHGAVAAFCARRDIGLVVIGPEGPLVAGLADDLRVAGIPVFGPSAAAAQLEGSKGFTKDLCRDHAIPTARYVRAARREAAEAALSRDFSLPVVLKADGLAAGKGVFIPTTPAERTAALDAIFAHGDAELVIEDFLTGEEVSLFVLTDGVTILPFGTAQDHKRVGDGDTGPNTGGMGAYSPAAVLTPELEQRALDEIVRPTLAALAARGTPFSGIVFAGLMLTPTGPQLIEYNARFGDPECQVLMLRFAGDLVATLRAVAETRLADLPRPEFTDGTALTVVLAANGYPGPPVTGGAIGGIAAARAAGATVFQAGTRHEGGRLVASGGRVLTVAATGPDVAAAQAAAYHAVDRIEFPTGFCRRDIGWREMARRNPATPPQQ